MPDVPYRRVQVIVNPASGKCPASDCSPAATGRGACDSNAFIGWQGPRGLASVVFPIIGIDGLAAAELDAGL